MGEQIGENADPDWYRRDCDGTAWSREVDGVVRESLCTERPRVCRSGLC